MSLLKKQYEIDGMLIVGQKLNSVFSKINFRSLVGKSTLEIDNEIADLLLQKNLYSCTKGYKGYLYSTCISINNVLVHGVPNQYIIQECDFVKIDIAVTYNGFCADACRWYADINKNKMYQKMVECAERSLDNGIKNCLLGSTIGDISYGIEQIINLYEYAIVKDFAGHGIGKKMHEDPIIPNYFDCDDMSTMKQKIYPGMAFAIEPMFCEYSAELEIDKNDCWSVATVDKGLTMHIEDTVLVTEKGLVITTRL